MKNESLRYFSKHRGATWLELFFDLVFVAVLGVIIHEFAHTHENHISAHQLTNFIFQFLVVWWVWASHTLYCNWFDTDSKLHRIATLSIMLLLITFPAFLIKNLDTYFSSFVFVYIVIRCVNAGLYFASTKKHGEQGVFAKEMGMGIVLASVVAGVSIFVPKAIQLYVFCFGLAIDIIWPILLGNRIRAVSVDLEHIVERTGLLSIILLGESVITLVASLSGVDWTSQSITAAVIGFVMLGAIWWIYYDSFNNLERAKLIVTGRPIIYSHLFVCLGLALLANLIGHTIMSNLETSQFALLAISGMVLFYLGKQIPYFIAFPNMRLNLIINTVVCVGITLLSTGLPNKEYTLIGMTVGMIFYVYANFKWTLSKDSSLYLLEDE